MAGGETAFAGIPVGAPAFTGRAEDPGDVDRTLQAQALGHVRMSLHVF
jgi:hypothetical protein